MKELRLDLKEKSYSIYIGKGLLGKAGELFNLKRKVLIVTDSGVPKEYSERLLSLCESARIITLPMGEGSKSFDGLKSVLSEMSRMEMGRSDCLVAVGGGVVGDLTGFAASCYMRGVDFYNIPTTTLSVLDSSIGGKTAINFEGIKNNVGAFHQPKGVLIDTDTLKTLDERQYASGLAEAVKMSLTSDAELFSMFENYSVEEIKENIEAIIEKALQIKKAVVEEDEKETGLRKILNFGHTFGHGIEAEEELHGMYHGECVAIGMLPVSSKEVRDRLTPVLKKLSLPTEYKGDVKKALGYVTHDKKATAGKVSVILVRAVGSFEIRKMDISEFEELVLSNM